MSVNNHNNSNNSILPGFLKRLSRSPSNSDSYDRAEKSLNGSNSGYVNSGGHRHSSSTSYIAAPRGKIFKILGVAIVLLTALYFFFPWSSSIASLGRKSFLLLLI